MVISIIRLFILYLKKIRKDFLGISLQRKLKLAGAEVYMPFVYFDYAMLKFDPPIYIGANSCLHLRAPLNIGSGTIIGPGLTVHTSNHRYEGNFVPYDSVYVVKEVVIEKNVWIGQNVTILPGVIIGEGAVIAANSVVVSNVPKFAIAAGNPATVKKYRDIKRYYSNINNDRIYLKTKKKP